MLKPKIVQFTHPGGEHKPDVKNENLKFQILNFEHEK